MEFTTQYRDDLTFQSTIFPENYMKSGFRNEFPLYASSSKGYLQDFHQIDQFHVDGLSSNLKFGISSPYFNQFETLANRSSSSFNIFNPMPLVEGGAMVNFHNRAFMNFSPRIASEALISQDRSSSLNFQDLESSSLAFSCIPIENRLCRKIDMIRKNTPSTSTSTSTSTAQKKANLIKGQWTTEEDRLLVRLVDEYGVKNWSHIAQNFNGRIGKQCRERWHNHLRLDIRKGAWTEEEDKIIIEEHAKVGNKWADISKKLEGRTENAIKNHWNATKRRQLTKRKYRCSDPRKSGSSSLLQDYILSLTQTSNVADNGSNQGINSNYDISNRPDIYLDRMMFPEEKSLESMFDEFPPGTSTSLEMETPLVMDLPLQGEMKRELDLLEMLSEHIGSK
ncbi:transcription repressor MYB4-like [Macadamia integrifolia]|uniref:transcription repressor MYB4-like n=1 Tax=Macadamia integrifolia TaxID=60698 RepID=UPI001C4ECFF7|nr:transcription repressor MYB4-like [Macadamia integrifolia]